MGLNFKNSKANWSYSGFNEFRRAIASDLGFNLNSKIGFSGEEDWSDVPAEWEPFLNHSDCEGKLSVKEQEKLIPAMLKLLDTWKDANYFSEYTKHHGYINGLYLCDTMKKNIQRGRSLVFC